MGIELIPFTETRRNPPRLVTIDRERLESLIANAIELLDIIDGDADIEDDEPDVEYDCREQEHELCGKYGIDQRHLILEGITI